MSSSFGQRRLPSDIKDFLSPSPASTSKSTKAYQFYSNESPALPSPLTIDRLQAHLFKNYEELEYNHSFIQWLFPLRTMGVNYQAPLLSEYEITQLRHDQRVKERYRKSYEIMLDFYGFELKDFEQGMIARSGKWKERYANLMRNSHNWLRVSRILKANSEFGFEHLNAPWLLYFLVEQSRPKGETQLGSPGLIRSMDEYWRHCIRNEKERNWVVNTIDQVRNGEKEWTEQAYDEALWRRRTTGSFEEDIPAATE